MISLWAIIKLTFRSAVRSHIFQLLLTLLLICVITLPLTVAGDGTAWGFIQVSLSYTLGILGFITSLSTVWLSCYVMTVDLESYQLHMVLAKPVSRFKVWFGKCLGVILIHVVLILISSAVVYGLIMYEFKKGKFTESEKKRIENEVLVGRRAYMPVLPNINEMAKVEYQQRLKIAKENGADISAVLSRESKALTQIRKEILSRLSEVLPGPAYTRFWVYEGLDPESKTPLYLRYRPYVGKIQQKNTQRQTMGIWMADFYLAKPIMVPKERSPQETDTGRNEEVVGPTVAAAKAAEEEAYGPRIQKTEETTPVHSVMMPKTEMPEPLMCGVFNELTLSPNAIQPNGTVTVGFCNFDPEGKSVFFQLADGPKLLIRICGFGQNFARAVLLMLLRVIFLAGLSCAIASIVSMPVAIFTVVSYMLFGVFSTYLVGAEQEMLEAGAAASVEWAERIGTFVSKVLLLFVIPLQNFEVSDIISGGELIEWNYILRCFVSFILFRGVPFMILGMYIYWRREMGLVIKR